MAELTTAINSNELIKIVIDMALLRSKLLSQPHSSLLFCFSYLPLEAKGKRSQFSLLHSKFLIDDFFLEFRAKNRKQEIQRISDELKRLEGSLRFAVYVFGLCYSVCC